MYDFDSDPSELFRDPHFENLWLRTTFLETVVLVFIFSLIKKVKKFGLLSECRPTYTVG